MRKLAVALLVASLTLFVGCQARDAEPAYVEGVLSAEAFTEGSWEWSSAADCALCHQLEAETAAVSSCEVVQTEKACATCHSDESALKDAHALPFDAPSAMRLRDTEADSASCERCHDTGDLARATAESGALEDTAGNIANPHALPGNDDHDEIECLDCHKIHQPGLVTSAQEQCLNCHHQGIYECYTCHS